MKTARQKRLEPLGCKAGRATRLPIDLSSSHRPSARLHGLMLLITLLAGTAQPAWSHQAQLVLPLSDRGMSTYYTKLEIEGYGEEHFMLDTGAGYTIINESILQSLVDKQLAHYSRTITGVMADGHEAYVKIYIISRMTAGSHCHYHDVEVAVMSGETRCILGMSLLRRMAPITLVTEPPSLAIGQCGDVQSQMGPDLL
jgi:hypothetical protein